MGVSLFQLSSDYFKFYHCFNNTVFFFFPVYIYATDTAEIVTVFPCKDNCIWQWLNQSVLGNFESLSAELE